MPDNVTADTTGGSTLPTISGCINGKPVFAKLLWEREGASKHDGREGVPHMRANQSSIQSEMVEQDYQFE